MTEELEIRREYYVLRSCAQDCRLNLGNTDAVAHRLAEWLDAHEEELAAHFAAQLGAGRPVLAHNRIQIALAGCPNACSEPQIRDFALIGIAVVGPGEGECSGCRLCERVCLEEAVTVAATVAIDESRCLRCGMCAAVCPTGALEVKARGYRVLVGGKLGRHPRLATELVSFCAEEECYPIFEQVLNFWFEHREKGERLGSTIERAGRPPLPAR